MIITVDFDGVIHDLNNREEGFRMGKPMKNAIYALRYLKGKHDIIHILSVRAQTEDSRRSIENWLNYFSVPFDDVSNKKVDSDCYVDDKGIHFTDWERTIVAIDKLRKEIDN